MTTRPASLALALVIVLEDGAREFEAIFTNEGLMIREAGAPIPDRPIPWAWLHDVTQRREGWTHPGAWQAARPPASSREHPGGLHRGSAGR